MDPSYPNPVDWDDSILAELADEAEAGLLYLKAFLRTREEVSTEEMLRRIYEGLPSNFFPKDFVIEDACLTNVKSIWLAKHVYL